MICSVVSIWVCSQLMINRDVKIYFSWIRLCSIPKLDNKFSFVLWSKSNNLYHKLLLSKIRTSGDREQINFIYCIFNKGFRILRKSIEAHAGRINFSWPLLIQWIIARLLSIWIWLSRVVFTSQINEIIFWA